MKRKSSDTMEVVTAGVAITPRAEAVKQREEVT